MINCQMELFGLRGSWLKRTVAFLEANDLKYEGGADYTILLLDENDEIVGTGSLCGNVLKYIAVDDAIQGEGGAASIVSGLVKYAYSLGRSKLFLFTKPKNENLFKSLGFYPMVTTKSVVYMENSRNGLEGFLASMQKGKGVQGAIVANCNPFTNGHRYLMEKAAGEVDTLHVFVVSRDSSEFSFKERFELVREGTKDIKNLILHESGDYMVSYATFPTYFIKDSASAEQVNVELDLMLFAKRIAPALNITKRFVGTEPYCKVTNAYNSAMKQILPEYGIEVIEIERIGGISASAVRRCMSDGNLEGIKALVPETTFEHIREKMNNAARYDK